MIFVCFYHEKRADFCRICPLENLYAMLRRRATASGMTSIRNSASSCVFVSSRLMRIVPFASSGDMPIAVSTWLGSSAPAEHAAPAETETPFMSRYRRRASASMPSKLIFKLPHSRSARETAVPACRAGSIGARCCTFTALHDPTAV